MAGPWSVEFRSAGRDGELVYRDGDRIMRIDCEAAATPDRDVLLAPIAISRWSDPPDAPPLSVAEQIEILRRLRAWLGRMGVRSDLERPAVASSAEACRVSGCGQAALRGSAYCGAHFDRSLLRG